MKALARQFGFAYAVRPNRGWYKKSGNLKYGFEISDGDFILLLDADFAPRRDLLDETLPYFALFPEVGIVQTPQYFHVVDEQTWVERGAGAIQELFYRSIQATRARKEGAICVGSCAVYRRTALAQNDGMSLAEHSEDLHTGFDLYRLGWRLRYLPIALSTGNCPDNVMAFLDQQYRWCSGTMSLMRDGKFWRTRLPMYSRLCYLAGLAGYAYTAVFTFIAPALAIGMLLFAPDFLLFKNMIFVAPVLFYAGVIYPMWHRSPYRLEAWSVRVLSGWAHVFALWDMLRGRLRGWQPSGTGAKRQDGRRRLWVCLIGWCFATSALWATLGLWRMMTMDAYNSSSPLCSACSSSWWWAGFSSSRETRRGNDRGGRAARGVRGAMAASPRCRLRADQRSAADGRRRRTRSPASRPRLRPAASLLASGLIHPAGGKFFGVEVPGCTRLAEPCDRVAAGIGRNPNLIGQYVAGEPPSTLPPPPGR